MAWFCERCDCFMFWNSYYCDDCRERDNSEREHRRKVKEEKNDEIKEEMIKYKKAQKAQIKKKYNTSIEFISEDSIKYSSIGMFTNFDIKNEDKVKIISKDKLLNYKITFIKEENDEIREALRELEDIKYETLK